MVVILIGTLKLTWIGPSITMITWIVGTPYPVATLPEVIGDGKSINFWCNTWLPHMVGEALNLPGRISSSLKYTVSDFLHNGSWNLTPFLQICALNLVAGIVQMDILISHRPNELIWEKYDSRSLTLKIAFNFLCGNDILLKRGCTIAHEMTGNYRGAREGGEGENEVIDSKSVVCEAMDLRCESIFKFEA
ncbi:hypothetical protein JHK84_027560 [Glycine max]|nr:hypothetical protein JHK84_027560 [Glycine max]